MAAPVHAERPAVHPMLEDPLKYCPIGAPEFGHVMSVHVGLKY